MENDKMILVEMICSSYNVEADFIDTLIDCGLIEVVTVEQHQFIDKNRVNDLERMIRLHYDLDINMEGIETITHLLQRMQMLQDEMLVLKNRLRFYEND